jgi:hypothetical protein
MMDKNIEFFGIKGEVNTPLCMHTCISTWHARCSTLYHIQTLSYIFFETTNTLIYILGGGLFSSDGMQSIKY